MKKKSPNYNELKHMCSEVADYAERLECSCSEADKIAAIVSILPAYVGYHKKDDNEVARLSIYSLLGTISIIVDACFADD